MVYTCTYGVGLDNPKLTREMQNIMGRAWAGYDVIMQFCWATLRQRIHRKRIDFKTL